MGYKPASKRWVQPRPEHYADRTRADGTVEKVLVGIYSLEQRDKYFEAMISLHKTRHPKATQGIANKATFQRWRNMIFATLKDEYVPVKKGQKRPPEAVELLKPLKPKQESK